MLKRAVMVSILVTACISKAFNSADTYTTAGTVIETNIIETIDGNIWSCETSISAGSDVFITFNGNNTTDVTDDEILSIELR